jgi:hypothetical protein
MKGSGGPNRSPAPTRPDRIRAAPIPSRLSHSNSPGRKIDRDAPQIVLDAQYDPIRHAVFVAGTTTSEEYDATTIGSLAGIK